METFDAYLDRKHQELMLLNSFLSAPLVLRRPASLEEVIEQKFHLAAALKAEHELHDWPFTETAWAESGRPHSGPFKFSYDYQRADLDVRGPSFYDFESAAASEAVYTSSGMAAISALLLATARFMAQADIVVLPGCYSETLELIEGYARHLRPLQLQNCSRESATRSAGRPRILLLDSCAPASAFNAALRCTAAQPDLVIFDTTCFSSGSGHIRRVLSWARGQQLPIVLVRSHTKLDSVGLEYGRLGSAVFVAHETDRDKALPLAELGREMRNAVRLLGSAALPAHACLEARAG